MQKIAVIGAGTMGNGIAHVFAQRDFSVALIDISEEVLGKALNTIERNLDRMLKKERITAADKKRTLQNIQTFTKLSDGVGEAELIVEAASENINIKRQIFQEMDQYAPKGAILASNTSSISITQIAAVTQRPEKVIGMHFYESGSYYEIGGSDPGLCDDRRGNANCDGSFPPIGESSGRSKRLSGLYLQPNFAADDQRGDLFAL